MYNICTCTMYVQVHFNFIITYIFKFKVNKIKNFYDENSFLKENLDLMQLSV